MKKMVSDAEEKYIKWFSSLGKESVKEAGGKGANLGEMYNLGMPVPPGFVILASAYEYFLEHTKLKNEIYSILGNLDSENTSELEEKARGIRKMIIQAEMPEDLKKEIFEAYEILSFNDENYATSSVHAILKNAKEDVFVAVRSSATAEDSSTASFAGQQETFVNIKGKEQVIEAVKRCFASLFTARSIYYRIKKGFQHEKVLIAVIVQQMIDSDKSGVIFSKDPIQEDENVVIEAVFGLGEGVVSGKIKPDHYVVSRNLKILSREISKKNIAIVRNSSGETIEVALTEEKGNQEVLKEHEIKKLADYAIKLEEHYKLAQDIEFAIDSSNIYIVQTRPITTLGKKKESRGIEGKAILTGIPASPGISSGEVRIVRSTDDLKKIVKGDVLVTKMTNPDMVVSMQKATAIVTDEGGSTCIEGDAKLLTNKGFIKLKDIAPLINSNSLYTLSLDTKEKKIIWRKIIRAYSRKAKANKVSAFIHPTGKFEDVISITPNHEILLLNGNNIEKKQLNELLNFDQKFLTITKIPKLNSLINISMESQDKLMYLTGAILSEGHIVKRKSGKPMRVKFCQKATEEKLNFIETVRNYFYELFNAHLTNYVKPNTIINHPNNYQTIRAENFECSRVYPAVTLNKMRENIVNLSLILEENTLRYFLAGFIDGDGHFNKEKRIIEIYIDRKTEDIKDAILIACLRVGIIPKVKIKGSTFRIVLSNEINSIIELCKRIVGYQERVEDYKLFSAKQLLEPLKINDWRGNLWNYTKKDRLVGINWLVRYLDKKIDNDCIQKIEEIKKSDISTIRMKLSGEEEIEVFNIEVEADSETDHNYIIFTKNNNTPIIVGNCHAAIISREMGIPAVVGTQYATEKLKEGMNVTVDGFKGKVYEGILKEQKIEIKKIVKTETKIKTIVDLPDFAARASETGCKEVGLVRLEGIIAESGKHPLFFLKNKQLEKYQSIIYEGISQIAEYFDELWVRTSDIRSDEYKNLLGASKEPELNPMLGMHGIRAGLKYRKILEAEILACKKLGEKKKVGIMMPQIISAEEVQEVKKIFDELGAENIKLGVMIETPAAVQIIDALCKEGIGFISFGTNDLTQFTLAIDRGNGQVQYLYDEMHPSVLSQLKQVIQTCKKYNVETSICGQAGSNKKMVEFLVKNGIDSISVNADAASEISEFVAELEKEGLRGSELKEKPAVKEIKETTIEAKQTRQEKTRHKVICDDCKKETEVPFKPDGIRKVYCKICLEKQRQLKLREKEKPEKEEKTSEGETITEKKEDKREETGIEENEDTKHEKTENPEPKTEFPETSIEFNVFSHQGEKSEESEETKEKTEETFYEETAEEIIEGEEITLEKQQEEKKTENPTPKTEKEEDVLLDIF